MSEFFDVFNQKKEIEAQQKIVDELLNENNLEQKTELSAPLKWSVMGVVEDLLDKSKLPNSKTIINLFTQLSFRYLISKDRQSRKEYVSALQSVSNTIHEEVKPKDLMR